MEINFFGKRTVASAIIASTIGTLLVVLHSCGISERDILKLYYEIKTNLHLNFPQNNLLEKEIERQLNDKLINDPELLKYKVNRDIDRAIQEYNRLTGDDGRAKITKPTYEEKSLDESVCYTKECQSLGGEIRLCSPWFYDCPKQNTEG